MSDVARHAGVSPMTVSRALQRARHGVGEDAAQGRRRGAQFGYLPNRIAGSLSSKRSNVVGLVVPSIRNSLYATMIQAISDVLRANGLHLMIANSGHRLDDEEALVSALLAQRVCGLVLHNTTHSKRLRELIAKHRRAGGRDRQPAGRAARHGGELLELRGGARHDRAISAGSAIAGSASSPCRCATTTARRSAAAATSRR